MEMIIMLKDLTKKFSKRMTLQENKFHGKLAEVNYATPRRLEGYEVKRTGRGHDFVERKVDVWTGKKGPETYVEVKSSKTAPLSKLQKKKMKEIPNYRVERGGGLF